MHLTVFSMLLSQSPQYFLLVRTVSILRLFKLCDYVQSIAILNIFENI